MQELDPRKQAILQAVVIEYVDAVEPVGSETLTRKYTFGVRSATIRSELAEMSDLGYLEQPHTSAGRIPSDLGYRYYVDRLRQAKKPNEPTKKSLKSVAEKGEALQSVLRDTSRALSRLTHMLTIAATFTDAELSLRNAIFTALGPSSAMLVLILSNGDVVNRMIACPPGLTLEDIGMANDQLTKAAAGSTLRALQSSKAPSMGSPAIDALLGLVWQEVRACAKERMATKTFVEGEEFILGQPEFQRDAGALADFLQRIADAELVDEALFLPGEGPQVTIGRENPIESWKRFSVIRESFFVGSLEAGVIGIVGPTRMRYDDSIPLVNYTAKILTDSLTRMFG